MKELIWLFPILFIVHDMEEIMGMQIWLDKNRTILREKYPMICKKYRNYSTEGMTAAVMEEMVICLAACMFSRFTGIYEVWLGMYAAYLIHLFIHIGQSIMFKQYIPALITSILCIPIGVWVLVTSTELLQYGVLKVVILSIIGLVVIVANLILAHKIIRAFTVKYMN